MVSLEYLGLWEISLVEGGWFYGFLLLDIEDGVYFVSLGVGILFYIWWRILFD